MLKIVAKTTRDVMWVLCVIIDAAVAFEAARDLCIGGFPPSTNLGYEPGTMLFVLFWILVNMWFILSPKRLDWGNDNE